MSRPSHPSGRPTAFDRALTDLAAGRPVLVYDGDDREGEADLLYSAAAVTSADISRLRNDGGGLVFCRALPRYRRGVRITVPTRSA